MSKEYLAFVRKSECLIGRRCFGDIVPHHLRSSSNSGIGMKPDDYFSVPMCFLHHNETHQIGQRTFQNKYDVDFWAILDFTHERFNECLKKLKSM